MRFLVIGLLVMLTGCAAEVLSTNPRSVTVKAPRSKVAEAQSLANAECAKHNRFARLSIRPTDGAPSLWIFDCVE